MRKEYGVTIVAVKPAGGSFDYATASTVLRPGDEVVVSGPAAKVEAFSNLS
ncbi:cation:proton antiporter regulatory subunit [Nocardioides sambongensis]|uniref:cation:proton antiporter regulatory subunit n=1 Tax=Nocardioides sambongensis TaxID=2589074 RepID=UPI001E44FC04|nr:TrkA C-terminal domain-containing protein [Nocardioides sambongensis]